MAKLTALKVRSLTKPGVYGDGGCLFLQVRSPTRRSWILRFTLHGRERGMGLGPADIVTLAEAREAALAARRLIFEGTDPIEKRRLDRLAMRPRKGETFQEVAKLYVDAHAAGWRNEKHCAQWLSTLKTYAYPVIGAKNVNEVDTAAVLRVLEPVWREKTETASRLRGRIEAVLDYAKSRGWRDGDNPARWRGHLSNLLPARARVAKVKHFAALPWIEMGSFMARLRGQDGVGALAMQFTILTAARTSEAIEARWSELDTAKATWIVPAERMKSGREHRVPLSDAALAILRQAGELRADPSSGAFVFPGRGDDRPLSNMALLALLSRMDREDLTTHGFRSTFRDWAAEATEHPRELAEAALAHVLRDKVEAAYRRGDLFAKRAALMQDWADWCALESHPAPAASADVVPIPVRRRRKRSEGQEA